MTFINSHTHHQKSFSENTIEIVNIDFDTEELPPHFSVGIHPWNLEKYPIEKQKDFVLKHIENKDCIAIGECGLDKKIETPMEMQIEVFLQHIQWAKEYQKPLIVHCVGAFQELIAIKKKEGQSVDFMVHGFMKNHQVATSLTKQGIFLSFGKGLLHLEKVQESFQKIPKDKVFLETDDSMISIEEVYKKAQELSQENIENRIKNNYQKLFKK